MFPSILFSILTFASSIACVSIPSIPTFNLQLKGKNIYLTTFISGDKQIVIDKRQHRNLAALTGTKLEFAVEQIVQKNPVVGSVQSVNQNLFCKNGVCSWVTDLTGISNTVFIAVPGGFVIESNEGRLCAHVNMSNNFYMNTANDLAGCAVFVAVSSST